MDIDSHMNCIPEKQTANVRMIPMKPNTKSSSPGRPDRGIRSNQIEQITKIANQADTDLTAAAIYLFLLMSVTAIQPTLLNQQSDYLSCCALAKRLVISLELVNLRKQSQDGRRVGGGVILSQLLRILRCIPLRRVYCQHL